MYEIPILCSFSSFGTVSAAKKSQKTIPTGYFKILHNFESNATFNDPYTITQ